MYQRPNLNGPEINLSRPDVIRRKMGVAYDVYNPMTDALGVKVELSSASQGLSTLKMTSTLQEKKMQWRRIQVHRKRLRVS